MWTPKNRFFPLLLLLLLKLLLLKLILLLLILLLCIIIYYLFEGVIFLHIFSFPGVQEWASKYSSMFNVSKGYNFFLLLSFSRLVSRQISYYAVQASVAGFIYFFIIYFHVYHD